jgi:glycosyltransferase involved in cell wall biosynthesis
VRDRGFEEGLPNENETQTQESSTVRRYPTVRILVVCSEFYPTRSGYAMIAYQLSREFRMSGHDVGLVTGGKGCSRIAKIAYLDSLGASRIRESWDVVQIIGPTPFFTEQVVWAVSRRGIPLVYTVNALPGLATYFRFPAVRSVDRLYERVFYRRALVKATHLVFNTEEFARFSGSVGVPSSIIPYGISESDLARDAQGSLTWQESPHLDYDLFRVLFVGQLRPYKGLETLLEAMALLSKQTKVRFTLTIAGGGPDETRLRRIVETRGLADVVRFLGSVDHDSLHPIYRAHNALVLPSMCGESFGIVLIEARAHGLIPIASDLPGVGDLARQLGGVSFPVGDADSLASRLRDQAASTSPLVTPLPPAKFLWSNVAAEYLSLYRRLASLNRGS